jgi:hypothetical protein
VVGGRILDQPPPGGNRDRPNPVIELTGSPARQALALLRAAGRAGPRDTRPLPIPTLGYRGLIIEPAGRRQPPIRTTDPVLEDFVCGSTGPLRRLGLGREFPGILRREIERYRELRRRWRHRKIPWPVRIRCRCAPLYEPTWWNDGARRQLRNNCYNYACNYRTDTLDFDWYRKGRNGYWSHKPGSTPVINVDNSTNLIADPRTADRGMYMQFCTLMAVMHGHVKIK